MPPQQQGVPIMPVPQAWGIDTTDDGEFIILAVDTPLGSFRFLVNHEAAEGLEHGIGVAVNKAKAIRVGEGQEQLLVPGKVLLGPDGQPAAVVPPNLKPVPDEGGA